MAARLSPPEMGFMFAQLGNSENFLFYTFDY